MNSRLTGLVHHPPRGNQQHYSASAATHWMALVEVGVLGLAPLLLILAPRYTAGVGAMIILDTIVVDVALAVGWTSYLPGGLLLLRMSVGVLMVAGGVMLVTGVLYIGLFAYWGWWYRLGNIAKVPVLFLWICAYYLILALNFAISTSEGTLLGDKPLIAPEPGQAVLGALAPVGGLLIVAAWSAAGRAVSSGTYVSTSDSENQQDADLRKAA
jgi:hypothetical protein